MFFIHFHFVYCKVWWKEEGDGWKITDQKEKKALLQRCLPNVPIFYHKYIYNILHNAFWLFTAGSLTTEALGSASIVAVTRHGFKEELVLKKEGVSPGNICILSAQLRNTIACGRWATAGQTSETRITPYLMAGIAAPLKASAWAGTNLLKPNSGEKYSHL